MTELYEFAKQVDVIAIFFILYGLAIWCWTKFKKHREKKRQEAKQPEE